MRRDIRIPLIGILLIVFGLAMFLDRLDVVRLRWGRVIWPLIAVYGAALIVLAFVRRKRGHLIWGNLLLYFGGCIALWQWRVIPAEDFYFLPLMSIAIGLSFLTTFIYEPGNLPLLIPVVAFLGFGVAFYLWWWEYVDWFDLRYYARRYWPTLLIAWGLVIVFRRHYQ